MNKKYIVSVGTYYEVEAEDEHEARDKAEQLLADEFERAICGMTELFCFNAEESTQ